MGLLSSLPPHRRGALSGGGWQWSFLDVVWGVFLIAVVVFLALVFTPRRGDPVLTAASVAIRAGGSGGAVPPCAASEVDLLPCEDPRRSSRLSREMNYYRERHCPARGEALACLVPPPRGYRVPVPWPESLHKIWHDNMPYGKIAERKGHQGWMKHEGSYFIFPGGGTMFPDGAEQYIEKLSQYVPLKTGVVRTGLDMGCGVASFGGFLLKENIMTLSFAPRDSHKSQIQFALERGIPAFLLMLGTRRLPFPAQSFDFVHCSRCLIPFTAYNGSYLIEADRLLRPGGYLIISGPPVRWKHQEKEWDELQAMAGALCYKLITVDGNTAIWKKPAEASCLPNQNGFGLDLCSTNDDPDEAWYFKLNKCVSKVSVSEEIAIGSVPRWPDRLSKPSARASVINNGASLFEADSQKWVRRVSYYKKSLGVKLGSTHIRNVMDMNAFFGGFAAAIVSDPVWVMNVVPAQKPLTLGVIYDRGLIGVYHDWCEPFSTYPRTYDLIHADAIDSLISDPISGTSRCDLFDVMLEMDRILRLEGTAVIRASPDVVDKASQIARSIRWKAQVHDSEPESAMTKGQSLRASWSFNYEKGLLDILHDHNHERFKGQNGWSPEGWRSIIKHSNEKFPSAGFSKSQIQDKEKDIKGNYKAIRAGIQESGVGWNDSLCMINALPDKWKKLIDDHPRLKKFQAKAFPLYHECEKLYEGSIATGELNFTSTEPLELHVPSSTQHVNASDINAPASSMYPLSAIDDHRASSEPIDLTEAEPTSSACSGQKGSGSGKKEALLEFYKAMWTTR